MNRLTGLVLSFFDVLEAEGRQFRSGALSVIRGTLILFFGLAFLFAGALAAGYALYLVLSLMIGRPGAAFVIALMLCAAGSLLIKKSQPDDGGGAADGGEAEDAEK